MSATTGPRKTISIHNYPEHLNPFHEEDNHNKIRFWTLGRKLSRSNSITFSGIKDLKNSWSLRSFMKKGKKAQTSTDKKANGQTNGETSPIVYRRALQYSTASVGPSARTTIGSPERPDRYVYGGSITPLPRSRFQERLRSSSNYEVNSVSGGTPRMARSDMSGSRLSVKSTNPFDEDEPVPPVRASRRKKKRAPLPPSDTSANVTVTSTDLETTPEKRTVENNDTEHDLNIENVEVPLNIELKIVEDEDVKQDTPETHPEEVHEKESASVTQSSPATAACSTIESNSTTETNTVTESKSEVPQVLHDDHEIPQIENEKLEIVETLQEDTKKSDTEETILDKVSFPKIDIVKYRRNSSLNEDDIKLRRGNLEDYQSITTKRSKSMNDELNLSYNSFDINLNENIRDKDANDNDQPQKVVCKVYEDNSRKQSLDNSISSTEREYIEISKVTRELEREISKLNSALIDDDDVPIGPRLSVSEIRRKFDNSSVPNPIPKPRRSHYGSTSPINGNYQT